MKNRLAIAILVIVLLLSITSCGGAPRAKPTITPLPPTVTPAPTLTPTITPTLAALKLENIRRLSLIVTGVNIDGFEENIQAILEKMEYKVAVGGGDYDALLRVELNTSARSARYQVNKTTVYKECFTGADVKGTIQLSAKNAIPLAAKVDENRIPPNTILEVCPDQSQAPYFDVGMPGVLKGLRQIFGDGAVFAATQVKKIQTIAMNMIRYEKIQATDRYIEKMVAVVRGSDSAAQLQALLLLTEIEFVSPELLKACVGHLATSQDERVFTICSQIIAVNWSAAAGYAPDILKIVAPPGKQNSADELEIWRRRAAIWLLGNVHLASQASIDALVGCLKDPNGNVRFSAVLALGAIPAPASAAVMEGIIAELVSSLHVYAQDEIVKALQAITGECCAGNTVKAWQTWWAAHKK